MAAEPQQVNWEGREENAPGLAAELEQELTKIADGAGLAVVWVRGERPAGVRVARDNSLCRFFQNRAESAPLCARDCGALAAQVGEPNIHRCHAGLALVRAPLPAAGGEAQALVGGRAFVTRQDYQALTERFRTGDLSGAFTPELFSNLLWATPARLRQLGQELAASAEIWHTARQEAEPVVLVESLAVLSELPDSPAKMPADTESDSFTPPLPLVTHSFAEACGAALQALCGACDLRRAALLWADETGFVVAAKLGDWQPGPENVAGAPQDLRLFLAAEAKSSLVLAARGDGWQAREEAFDGPEAAPLAELFPFLTGTEVRAALLVAGDELDDAKRRAVVTFGNALALPWEVLRLRQEASRRARGTDYAIRFAAQLNAPGQADDYSPIVANAAQLFHARRASLMVYDEAEGELAIKAGIGLPLEVLHNTRARLGEGVAGRALGEGRALLARQGRSLDERGYVSDTFISYPIFIEGRRGGVLNLTERAGGVFGEADVRLLDALAPQLALALDRAEWREKAQRFRQMSVTDPLTGLANRRYLMARLAEEVSRVARRHEPLSFMMLDLDDFKHYNDQNGHQAGDEALVLLADCLHSNLRGADVAARYGGEEFSILLPQTTLQEARTIGERIQWQVAETIFPYGHRQPGGAVTISIGVADYAPGRTTPDTIIKAADQALYQAKKMGKDLVQVYKD